MTSDENASVKKIDADRSFQRGLIASVVTGSLTTMVTIAGWTLFEFDRALFIYAQALVLSLSLTVYRFAIWVHRPPTTLVYQRAWAMARNSTNKVALTVHLAKRFVGYFLLNSFVLKRGFNRWTAHWPIMLGCVMAMAIVVPLVFGWIWFETAEHDVHLYEVTLFGQHVRTMHVEGLEAFVAFHGLVWAAFPVLIGTSVALVRRTRDRGDQATQTFGADLMPLIILMAIAVTGLLMTLSYSFLGGAFHTPLANVHCVIVVGTLLWLPFSKLFHIPQRSLKLAHMIYEHESLKSGQASCSRCGSDFAEQQQVQDLIEVQRRLGYRYEISETSHYQSVCPRCRRASLVIAQGRRWQDARHSQAEFI